LEAEASPALTVCSLCLRVQRDSGWSEAAKVIRETRSFELETLPKLEAALCDRCVEAVRARRAPSPERVAA
jgi:hypothetical protein